MEILLDDLKSNGYKVTTDFNNGESVFIFDTKLARYVAENVTVVSKKVQIPTTYDSYDAWLTIESSNGIEDVRIVRPYVDIDLVMSKFSVTRPEAIELERVARSIIDTETRGFHFWLGIEELIGQGGDILPIAVRTVEIHRVWENAKIVYDVDNAPDNDIIMRPTRNSYGIIADIAGAPWLGSRDSYNVSQYSNGAGYFQSYYDYYVEGAFGWAMIPQAIKDAMLYLINDLKCGNITYTGNYITSMHNDRGSISYSKEAYCGTGNFFTDKLIEPYKEYVGRIAII